jgi:hypothetical protein
MACLVAIAVAVLFTKKQTHSAVAAGKKAEWELNVARKPKFEIGLEADSSLVVSCRGPENYSSVEIAVRSANDTYRCPIRLQTTAERPSEAGRLGSMKMAEERRVPYDRIQVGAGGSVIVDIQCTAASDEAILTSQQKIEIVGSPIPMEMTLANLFSALLPALREFYSTSPLTQDGGLSASRLFELLDSVARVARPYGNCAEALAACESSILVGIASWRQANPGHRVVTLYSKGDLLRAGEYPQNCGSLPPDLDDESKRGRALRSLYMNGQQSAWVADYATAPPEEKDWAYDGTMWPCYAYVPIQAGGRKLGLIEIACRQPGAISEVDLESFELFAKLLAIAHLISETNTRREHHA